MIRTSLQTDKHTNNSIFTGWMLFLMPKQHQSSESNAVVHNHTAEAVVR